MSNNFNKITFNKYEYITFKTNNLMATETMQ